jgi:hypothetical protein
MDDIPHRSVHTSHARGRIQFAAIGAVQITRICTVVYRFDLDCVATQNGGSARDYQGLPRTVGNPGYGHPGSGEFVFLCIASARVNFRFCRK